MNKELIENIFPGTMEHISNKQCPICKNKIGVFKDTLSEKEYRISGLCQECQDGVFK